MIIPQRRASPRRAGYSLVEMLMVLAIMTVLFAVAARGAKKSWEGQEIKASALKLAGDISLASMTAVKLNRPVQIRFYKYNDPQVAAASPQFHAYQLLVEARASTVARWDPLYEIQDLEGTTLMSTNPIYSTLLDRPQRPNQQDAALMGGIYSAMEGLEYTAVEFRPDGSTNLADRSDNRPWTVTLVPARTADDPQGELPPYFQTLAVVPDTGAVRIF
jgi:uncharacterized protein (TIGR02596 family)